MEAKKVVVVVCGCVGWVGGALIALRVYVATNLNICCAVFPCFGFRYLIDLSEKSKRVGIAF